MRTIALVMVLAVAACGDSTTEPGPVQPTEPDHTRVVYEGSATTESSLITIPLPTGLSMDDPPLFGCYRLVDDTILRPATECQIRMSNGRPVVWARDNGAWEYRVVIVH